MSDRERFLVWLKATVQLMVRGGAIAVVAAVGVTTTTVGSAAVFDQLFTVTTAKAFAAGAVLSLLFSWISGKIGDPTRPTIG